MTSYNFTINKLPMKRIIVLILFLYPLTTWGQKITFATAVQNTYDSAIVAVRDLWKSYLTNSKNGFDLPSPNFWNKYEIENGYNDLVKVASHMPTYLVGNIEVFDIKKVDNSYYRIRNIWSFGENNDKTIIAIFSVFAKGTDSVYKLFNNFFILKSSLKHFETNNIDFYYPVLHSFDSLKATRANDFYSSITLQYAYTDKRKLIYIIGNNLDEAFKLIGFDYFFGSDSSPLAGYSGMSKNFLILSGREDHIHEIVHSVFMSMFPNGHMLFQEGIATYYGGNVARNLSYFIGELKKLVKQNPNVDLSKIDEIDKILNDGKVNNFYFIGAIFIDYALKNGGPKKVLALLNYPVTNQYSFDDAISAINKELGIEKNNLDAFIKNYVQNFKDN